MRPLSQLILLTSLISSVTAYAVPFSDLKFKRQGRESIALVKATNQPYSGVATANFDNGNKDAEAHYVNGHLHGARYFWFENGQLEREEYFLNGKKHGPSYLWFEDGRLKEQHHWLNGEEHGTTQTWALNSRNKDADGNPSYQPSYRTDYQFGRQSGESLRWENGATAMKTRYVNGNRSGEFISYRVENKKPYLETEEKYLNREEQGLTRKYFPNGTLKQEYFETTGDLEGLSLVYLLNDNNESILDLRGFYHNDERRGMAQEFKDGTLIAERSYRDGITYGLFHLFSPQGNLNRFYATETGKQIEIQPNANQRTSESYQVERRFDGWQLQWFSNGKIASQTDFEQGSQTPFQNEWYDNGQQKYQVIQGNQDDLYIENQWYKNGQIKSNVTFRMSSDDYGFVQHGEEKQWYSNGQLKLATSYKNGEQVGNRRTWLDDGTLYSESEQEMGN